MGNAKRAKKKADKDPNLNLISGRFIVDGQHFLKGIRGLEKHNLRCLKSSEGWFQLVSCKVMGCVWQLQFQCPFCLEKRCVTSEPTEKNHDSITMKENSNNSTPLVGEHNVKIGTKRKCTSSASYSNEFPGKRICKA